MSARPLDGIRVIDAATIVAGPLSASILGEFGADVVKVEQPDGGDPMRTLGTAGPAGDSYWWWTETRNKTSVVLDLRTPDGAESLRRMTDRADVLIENYRTGTMEKWGLGYQALAVRNPRLVQLSVSGFGRVGPLRESVGVARIAEAFCGLSSMTGDPDGPPGLSGSAALADYLCAVYGAFGVVLALRARETTGTGQLVDMALTDGVARIMDEAIPMAAALGDERPRLGSETHRSVPHSNYESRDGRWVTIACSNDRMFDRLVAEAAWPALTDPRFATNADRIRHRAAVNAAVAAWVAELDATEVVARCDAAGVPSAVVATVAEYVAHPQTRARDSVVDVDDERFGRLTVPGVVPRLTATPGRIDRLGARLGETTVDEILERWT